MLSTASAINATLYGAARLSYSIARDGELPATLERKVWGQPIEGLLITAGLTLLIANVFDLTSIATLGSAGFLLIFAAVNVANARHASHAGSRVLDLGRRGCRVPRRVGRPGLADDSDLTGQAVDPGGDARPGDRDRGRLPAGEARAPTGRLTELHEPAGPAALGRPLEAPPDPLVEVPLIRSPHPGDRTSGCSLRTTGLWAGRQRPTRI